MSEESRSIPHQKTRDHHAGETAEDYVEAVYEIIQDKGECRVKDLAGRFHVSHVTVSRIVGRLQKKDLLSTQPYRPIVLTSAGEKLAQESQKRHRVVFEFLLSIGVDEKTAEIDSEGIEHHVSGKTLAAMRRFIREKTAGK